jgi:hypothetical protein
MISEAQLNRLKIGDKVYVNSNLYDIMKHNWGSDMILTKNKYGTILEIGSNYLILHFKELEHTERDHYMYTLECLSIQLPAIEMYKPRKKIQI